MRNTGTLERESQIFSFRLLQFKHFSHGYSRARRINLTKKKKRQRWSEGGDTSLRLPVVPQGALSFHLLSWAPLLIAGFGKNSTTKEAVNSDNILVGSIAVGYYMSNRDKF